MSIAGLHDDNSSYQTNMSTYLIKTMSTLQDIINRRTCANPYMSPTDRNITCNIYYRHELWNLQDDKRWPHFMLANWLLVLQLRHLGGVGEHMKGPKKLTAPSTYSRPTLRRTMCMTNVTMNTNIHTTSPRVASWTCVLKKASLSLQILNVAVSIGVLIIPCAFQA